MAGGLTELQRMEEEAREVAAVIIKGLKAHAEEHPEDPKVGFVLWMFQFGDTGWATYASNADRGDVIGALKELLAKLEG